MLAAKELQTAEVSLLEAQTAQEYAASIVDYNTKRITRLRKFLATQERDEKDNSRRDNLLPASGSF